MAIEVKFRRGTSVQHSSFTGANGEITVDTTNKTLRVHDGVTVSGIRIAKFSDIINNNNLANVSSNIVPSANVTYDLGTANNSWRSLYLSGNTIYLGGTKISKNNDGSLRFTDSANNTVALQVASITVSQNTNSTFANATITNLILQNVLGTQYGGTGLSSLTQNGVLFASNSSSFSFATGAAGKVLQVNSSGVPVFDVLDGGEYS
jgi:hypothetical protein